MTSPFKGFPWLTPFQKLATILASAVDDGAEMILVQGSRNYRINVAQLKVLFESFGGGGVALPIAMSDVTNLVTSLAGKAGINGELINASAFRTALGLDTLDILNAVPAANAAARLALSANTARNALVRETDTGISYMLVANGVPATSGDWVKVADITPAIADIPGLQTALAAITPTIDTAVPVDSNDAVNLDNSGDISAFNGLYEDYGQRSDGVAIFAFGLDGQQSWRRVGGIWKLYSDTGNVIAESDSEEMTVAHPADVVTWILVDEAYSPIWSNSELTHAVGSLGTAGANGSTIRVGDVDYRCVHYTIPDDATAYRWVALGTNGTPISLGQTQAGLSGYIRYTVAGTTSPVTAGMTMYEVSPGSKDASLMWSSDGKVSPPASGAWADLFASGLGGIPPLGSAGGWQFRTWLNGAVVQTWARAATHPAEAGSWTQLTGPGSAGLSFTQVLSLGRAGVVGQVACTDPVSANTKSPFFDTSVCVKTSPYYEWVPFITSRSFARYLAQNGIVADNGVIGISGVGPTYLNGKPTVDLPKPMTQMVSYTDDHFALYEITSSTTNASDLPLIVKPDDWHISTNGYRWFLKSWLVKKLTAVMLRLRHHASGYHVEIDPQTLTADRVVKVADRAGTLALTSRTDGRTEAADVVGTGTNDNAAAGRVGEYMVSTGIPASSLTNGTTVNATSLVLTPGDWDVEGNVVVSGTSAANPLISAAIAIVSATIPGDASVSIVRPPGPVTGFTSAPAMRTRVTVAVSTTVTAYLVVQGGFTGGSMTLSLFKMTARRVR